MVDLKVMVAFYQEERRVKSLIVVFIVGLVLSGLTAFPLEWETARLNAAVNLFWSDYSAAGWVGNIHKAIADTNQHYPFLAYGTDWLAFGHMVIALFFIGAWRDPIRNKWVIDAGLVACAAVFPLAVIAGPVRQIPFYWTLIDCCFGLAGGSILLICRKRINALEQILCR